MPLSSLRSYLTIAGRSSAEVEVRRSRFICELERVESEQGARGFIEGIRSGSREARHHCTAFILGPDGAIQRSNDDGEPSGTAGAPMLEVLRGRGVSDVVAVVTRWFGGVLLGTGGLIRAYGDAVGAGLDAATLVARELRLEALVDVSHADGPRVENALRSHPGTAVVTVDYLGTGVRISAGVEPDGFGELAGFVASLTSGAGTVSQGATTWVDAGTPPPIE
ncbi:MAG TPA: YigZ family protein [Intrasporangium sp.]|uniref:IMPACT family protein n=1 Tax=Intrasporangium sp. TaxID=1925024 RepID=UPI002B4811C9|nr:YigZ family protein [Intrasporangium sp.]HKX69226.1 YigZ family protein [Intrasporangium sp.]